MPQNHAPAGKPDVYQQITRRIVQAIEAGAEDWQMPWHKSPRMPTNVETQNPYHGVNVLALWSAAMANGYVSPYWGTYRQWQNNGGQILKGEKASPIAFWKFIEREQEDPVTHETDTVTIPYARYSSVFNAE